MPAGLAARSRSGSLGLGSGQKTGSFASLSSRSRSGSGHLPNSIGTGRLLPDRAPPRAGNIAIIHIILLYTIFLSISFS